MINKESLLEKLLYIKEKGVKIEWSRLEVYSPIFLANSSQTFIPLSEVYPPVKPPSIILYTNSNLEDIKSILDMCIDNITKYEAYVASLENKPEVLELKEMFEKCT